MLDDSDESVKEFEGPVVQVQSPPPAVVDVKPVVQVTKPEAPVAVSTPIKKTRQHKDKLLEKKASAPAKQTITVVKRAPKPVVTKPPTSEEEPKPNRLKIKIKKIAKHSTKSDSGKER